MADKALLAGYHRYRRYIAAVTNVEYECGSNYIKSTSGKSAIAGIDNLIIPGALSLGEDNIT